MNRTRYCELKSTGTLVDELGTLDLKIAAGNTEAQERRHELANAIIERTSVLIHDMQKYREFQRVSNELNAVLKECWDAQETIMRYTAQYHSYSLLPDEEWELAGAAIKAQQTNAARNVLIRKLDELVGETERTQLAKTYA